MQDLFVDLAKMQNFDTTWVSERGENFSTGQRARISLARAVYSRSKIYLIDDFLVNIDSTSRNLIVENVFRKELKNKTIIFVSNSVNLLELAEKVILVEDGKIIANGTVEEIKNHFDLDEEALSKDIQELSIGSIDKYIVNKRKT